ncbi:U-box domain-containing protein 9-like [Cornus florida]|uniref:U-box domain-containing protein 9-like n=1 Tax=Cornus florida TaxID=4283 RepID=UPI0028A29B0B|nr:U-box domain-containing protein 9-like [Cornus florida]
MLEDYLPIDMAKTGVKRGRDIDPTKATELKEELQRLVKAIVDDDDVNIDTINEAVETLSALKDLKVKKPIPFKLHKSLKIPEEFRCPISQQLIIDPVSSGQTYDRMSIVNLLRSGNQTCPHTQQNLLRTTLRPNPLLLRLISQWCQNHGVHLPDPEEYSDEYVITDADRSHFLSLLVKMSSTPSDQKEAARELRLFTTSMPSFRALFAESESAIRDLLKPLSQTKSQSDIHPDLHEDLISILSDVLIHDYNENPISENASMAQMVIPRLIDSVRSGRIETRSMAALALSTLAVLDSNKEIIGEFGALKPLIDLLEEGHPLAMNDVVASAIFNLCTLHENQARAVRDDAVRVMLKKITEGVLVHELLDTLAQLSNNEMAVEELGKLDAVPCLLGIIRESSSAVNNEKCIVILHKICFGAQHKWKEMIRDEENSHKTITKLARNGTSRAQEEATAILEKLNMTFYLTHTI